MTATNPLEYLTEIVELNYKPEDSFFILTKNNLEGITQKSKKTLSKRIKSICSQLDKLKMPTENFTVEALILTPYPQINNNISCFVFDEQIDSKEAMSLYIGNFIYWIEDKDNKTYFECNKYLHLSFNPTFPLKIPR